MDTADREQLRATLSELSEMVAHRLRRNGLFARTVGLKLRYSDFRTLTRARTLPEAADLDLELQRTVLELFDAAWNGRPVRLLGVQASGLTPREGQLNLLETASRQKWQQALEAADRVRERFGFGAVHLGGALGRKRDDPDK